MIKGCGFLKLLKLSFSILLIGFFGLLGNSFVNAGYSDIITKPNGQLIDQGQGGIKFQVSGNGSLLSQYLGLSRRVLAFEGGSPKVYFWWGLNGVPYAYYYYSNDNVNLQGYYNKYQVCDELTGGSVSVSNCVTYNVNNGSFYESLTPFFNSVKSSDYFGYSYGWYVVTIRTYYLRVCFSSHEFGQSVCFMTSDGLNNSLGLESNISFGDLSQSVIGNPPGYSYGGGSGGQLEGSVEVNSDNTFTGDYVYSTCSIQDIIDYSRNAGLTDYLCYGGLDNWDNYLLTGIYNPVPGTGKTLENIYGYTNDGKIFDDWFNYWNVSYINQYTTNQSIWLNQPAVLRSYFKIFNDYGGSTFDYNVVRAFCGLLLEEDKTIEYKGGIFSQTCKYIKSNDINVGNSGENIEGGNWDGVGNLSGGKTYNNPSVFLQDFFNKLKANFPTKGDLGFGYLPNYIISFLLALILWRFLAH